MGPQILNPNEIKHRKKWITPFSKVVKSIGITIDLNQDYVVLNTPIFLFSPTILIV